MSLFGIDPKDVSKVLEDVDTIVAQQKQILDKLDDILQKLTGKNPSADEWIAGPDPKKAV